MLCTRGRVRPEKGTRLPSFPTKRKLETMTDFHYSERDDQVFPELFNKGKFILEPGTKRNAHNATLKALLGLGRKSKLPAAGLPAQTIQGIRVWVEPAPPVQVNTKGRRGSRPHRIMGECPHCAAVMSAGRLFQHKCKE